MSFSPPIPGQFPDKRIQITAAYPQIDTCGKNPNINSEVGTSL